MKIKAILSTVLVIFLSACSARLSFNTDAEKVASIAAEIADFDLPIGYRTDFSASLLGYQAAAFHPGDGHSHLYLIQSDHESDGKKLVQMLGGLVTGTSDQLTRMTVMETRLVTVRGQDVTLVISDGVNSEGKTYRQALVPFQGKGGPALLVLSEPHSRWDQAVVDAFIASLR